MINITYLVNDYICRQHLGSLILQKSFENIIYQTTWWIQFVCLTETVL